MLTTVPDVAGAALRPGGQQLKQAGFQVADGGYRNSGYAADTVAYTNPGGGSQIASGTTVTIYRSDGTPYVPPRNTTTAATTGPATEMATATATLAQLPLDLRGDRAAVGAPGPGLDRADHLAHGPHRPRTPRRSAAIAAVTI